MNDITHQDDYQNILKIRQVYHTKVSTFPYTERNKKAAELDEVVLVILANLKDQEILFSSTHSISDIRRAKVVSVKNRVINMWEGYHKRRYNIKNLIIYHDAVYAALLCL